MKKKYEYKVGTFHTATREAARIIQRSLRSVTLDGKTQVAPKIIQKVIMERVVR